MVSKTKNLVMTFCALMFLHACTSSQRPAVSLSHGVDASAGGDEAYIIAIKNAVFFLEKSFHKAKGSAHKGEYRGFPNAVHKQDGNYFHAMNAGTDMSSSVVDFEKADHVRITFTSGNGAWKGQWDFYPDRCDFTMLQVSEGYKYWVQYEGVPGGEMDRSDFRYSSAGNDKHLIDDSFIGDLPAPEWMAFGDEASPRMLYMLQHEDDDAPNDYVSRPDMTVLGFGRRNKDKFLTTPITFSIGFAETTDYEYVQRVVTAIAP